MIFHDFRSAVAKLVNDPSVVAIQRNSWARTRIVVYERGLRMCRFHCSHGWIWTPEVEDILARDYRVLRCWDIDYRTSEG